MPAAYLAVRRLARHAPWVAVGAACSASIACSSKHPPTPAAFMVANLTTSAGLPGLCPFASQQWLDVGSEVAPPGTPGPVEDGHTTDAGAPVKVTCTVSASNNGFNVLLDLEQQGAQGGSVTFQGQVTTSGGTVGGVFENANNGTFRDPACTITYTYQGEAVSQSPPVAGGRIWGHASCPNAQISGQTGTGPDGGEVNKTCDAEADFLFQNCSE